MQPKHDGQIFCPRDGVPMAKVNDRGQTIDVCPHCRGKWLDEGEMEAILAALSVMPGFSVQRLQSHHGGHHGGDHGHHGGHRRSSDGPFDFLFSS